MIGKQQKSFFSTYIFSFPIIFSTKHLKSNIFGLSFVLSSVLFSLFLMLHKVIMCLNTTVLYSRPIMPYTNWKNIYSITHLLKVAFSFHDCINQFSHNKWEHSRTKFILICLISFHNYLFSNFI